MKISWPRDTLQESEGLSRVPGWQFEDHRARVWLRRWETGKQHRGEKNKEASSIWRLIRLRGPCEGKTPTWSTHQTWVTWENHDASCRVGKPREEGSLVGKLVISGFGDFNVKWQKDIEIYKELGNRRWQNLSLLMEVNFSKVNLKWNLKC